MVKEINRYLYEVENKGKRSAIKEVSFQKNVPSRAEQLINKGEEKIHKGLKSQGISWTRKEAIEQQEKDKKNKRYIYDKRFERKTVENPNQDFRFNKTQQKFIQKPSQQNYAQQVQTRQNKGLGYSVLGFQPKSKDTIKTTILGFRY